MNYRDRGIIKFSPFLMPEHCDMLAELREKEDDVTLSYHDEQRYLYTKCLQIMIS